MTATTAPALTSNAIAALVNAARRQARGGRVTAFPIVEYRGSLTHVHGLWRVTDVQPNGRLVLRDAHGQRLTNVGITSVELVPTPALTELRAEALRILAERRGTVGTRVANWLVAQGLAERDGETGRLQTTWLGFQLAHAVRRFAY